MTIDDDIDKKILNIIQTNFPIHSRPYKIIADKLEIGEEQLIDRVKKMKQDQFIRRIGGNFSPDKLGYYSTLCTAQVPENKIELFVNTVNAYKGVTHNYKRNHKFNIWFTFIALSNKIIKENLNRISKKTGVKTILNLPAVKVFKISANFKFQ